MFRRSISLSGGGRYPARPDACRVAFHLPPHRLDLLHPFLSVEQVLLRYNTLAPLLLNRQK
jgi:hypothetical protein